MFPMNAFETSFTAEYCRTSSNCFILAMVDRKTMNLCQFHQQYTSNSLHENDLQYAAIIS